MKQKKFWLKLIGTALLLHASLILLSIIEVTIYSYLIVPGKAPAFYETHASVSGPWVSAIFGSLLMFLLARRFLKRFDQQQLTYVLGLPGFYLAIDLLLVFAAGYQSSDFVYPFVLAAVPKIAAALLAYFLYRKKSEV